MIYSKPKNEENFYVVTEKHESFPEILYESWNLDDCKNFVRKFLKDHTRYNYRKDEFTFKISIYYQNYEIQKNYWR